MSNRLPLVLRRNDEELEASPGSGGLVTALAPVLRRFGGLWVGWPGVTTADGEGESAELADALAAFGADAGHGIVPVELTADDLRGFYEGYSNEIIWPLFHDLQSHCNFVPEYWTSYTAVVDKFAQVVAREVRPDDFIWVQDYHLMGVGGRLRELGLRNRLGFFLHIPFPAPDMFAKLPWRTETLVSILGHDTVGLQTPRDQRNFTDCVRLLLPEARVYHRRGGLVEIVLHGRTTVVGAFPIGLDFEEFAGPALEPQVEARVAELREQMPNRQVVISVDRLDYTKGIPYRLRAVELALQQNPELHRAITLLQIVVPSRETVPEYQELRGEIEQLVSQVNGQFTEPGWVPIQHMFRSIDRDELIASYRVADIALVTPLKDGMNLVAKEYCACQTDGDGTLILSEFAGAAFQFRRNALLVNPYDIQTVADSILLAATMPRRDRVRRMRRLRENVRTEDVYWWVRRFLECSGIRLGDPGDASGAPADGAAASTAVPLQPEHAQPAPVVLSFEESLAAVASAPVLLVASDFDGTVSPIVSDPAMAEAGAAALRALQALSELPDTHVAVISGRALADLGPRMLDAPGVELVGGHGTEFASRFVEPLTSHAERFLDQIRAEAALIEHEFRGMFLERKPASLAVHYRNVEEHLHERAVAAILAGPARHESLHVRRGKKVIELSVLRADKGGALERIRDRVGASAVVFVGDDVTDEDAFAALTGPDIGVKVGPGDTMARHRVDTTDDVAHLLQRILELRRG